MSRSLVLIFRQRRMSFDVLLQNANRSYSSCVEIA